MSTQGALIAVSALVLLLAWVNGANDIAKGVATLVGNGTAGARRSVLWGTLWTVLGGVAAAAFGTALIHTFSYGYLDPDFHVDMAFVASAVGGAVLWVLVATRLGLPVSTTHALLGGVAGAALASAGPDGLLVGTVTNKALVPLLVSPLLAVLLCAGLLVVARLAGRRVPRWVPGCCERKDWLKNPFVCAEVNGMVRPATGVERMWVALHWVSSGATSFARALNDVPKIAAFLILASTLAPGTHLLGLQGGILWPVLAVTTAMALGSLWGGFRVLNVLAHRIVPMDASSGLIANLGTSSLVLLASPFGLPVSTTHVSTGALVGVRWADRVKPDHADALKMVLIGWVVTLPVAAVIAGAGSWMLR